MNEKWSLVVPVILEFLKFLSPQRTQGRWAQARTIHGLPSQKYSKEPTLFTTEWDHLVVKYDNFVEVQNNKTIKLNSSEYKMRVEV